ncbi:MAG TPA: DUF2840 domain-containing protein [Alphaproteobacteria bacterium]|nr:DUF2840 domain-containing protein [Alphaproteobacteria bacterium]
MTATVINGAQVDVVWIEGRVNHWLRFGRWRSERVHSRSHRMVTFDVGAVFGYLRWQANDYGTIAASFAVVRVVEPHQILSTHPGVHPGGELLLCVRGWARVQRVLEAIDQIEASRLDPARVAPGHWRHLHNRIEIGQPFRRYSREQHRAWELRRSIGG